MSEPNPASSLLSQEKYLENLRLVSLWTQKVQLLAQREQEVEDLRKEIMALERNPLLSNLRGQVRGASRASTPSAAGSTKVPKGKGRKEKAPSPDRVEEYESTLTSEGSALERSSKKQKRGPGLTGIQGSQEAATI